MRALLDTSVLVAGVPVAAESVAISVVSIAELEYGVLRGPDGDERERRSLRLARVRATHEPLPVDERVASAWGALAHSVLLRGRQPRRRSMDLLIAATAQVHGLTLLTRDEDLLFLEDVLDVRPLTAFRPDQTPLVRRPAG